ncbi:MAG: hypothetical protein JRI68_13115 [Deltaproteobacteria bacterium]|nr:hypothetical protein [Deltaproteobacteria bacterium]
MTTRAATVAACVGLAACNSIWGVDGLQFGSGATTTSNPGGGGSQGGTTASGGFGAAAGSGGNLGGTGGGSGGSGGAPPALIDRELVARYYLDEAAAGQEPTAAQDSAADPLDLPLTYAAQLSYVEVDGNRGLRWTTAGSAGRATVPIGSTKVHDRLDDSTQVTVELVVDVEDSVYFDRLMHVGEANQVGGELALALPSGANTLSLHPYGNAADNAGEWTVGLATAGRVVVHLVMDTNLATQADRTRLFVDGVAAPLTTPATTTYVPFQAGDNLDLDLSSTFTVGNKPIQNRSMKGTIFYLALYAVALTTTEIEGNVKLLQVSDDHP